jgi:YD repeat-containing protein
MWDEPETITEKIGSVTRTTKKVFDVAGRETASEETSTASEEAALPAVNNEYNSETGALEKQSETLSGKTKTITNVNNTLGQMVSYTDAEGSSTKYTYDVDGRVEEVSEPKGRQVYSYDPTSGFMTKLLDTAAGTFTATYDVTGNMLTEVYPNGMTAKYARNSVGQTTGLEYEKTTHCSEKCVWFSDSEAYGPNSEIASQASTLSSEAYSYNEAGELTETQETPVGGKGCVTRLYSFNEETDGRESSTTREPNEKGECATSGGVVEGHFYDTVGRLLDPGVTYDQVGNITKMPAYDAGGSAVTSSFYVDNQVATQEQSEKNVGYVYDPSGRTMTATLKSKSSTVTTISHYVGPGNAIGWACEEAGECKEEKESKWTRDIPGIDGSLDAVQENSGAVVLQLHDLQNNIVATAADNETETKLLSTHNSIEFGVPTGTTPKYSWLGGEGVVSELGTGVVTSGGGSYVPQAAQTLQSRQVVPPGAAPNGNKTTEAYLPPELSWANQSGDEGAANTLAEQKSLEEEACQANPLSCSEDPGWVVSLNIPDAEMLSGAMEGLQIVNEFGLLKLSDMLKNYLGIDFISQLKESISRKLFGFSWGDAEVWSSNLVGELTTCVEWEAAQIEKIKPKNAHCWIYIPTIIQYAGKNKKGYIGEYPDFNVAAIVEYCPLGPQPTSAHRCFNVGMS